MLISKAIEGYNFDKATTYSKATISDLVKTKGQ
jgi:hypothetical protein